MADSYNAVPAEGDGLTYEHLADRDSLWLDFIADTGDGGAATYSVAAALAAPHLRVALPPERRTMLLRRPPPPPPAAAAVASGKGSRNSQPPQQQQQGDGDGPPLVLPRADLVVVSHARTLRMCHVCGGH